MIEVKNKKSYKGNGVYIGRPSVFGNPYSHLECSKAIYKCDTREESIQKYEDWLKAEVKTNENFKKEFDKLCTLYKNTRHLILICWCKPLSCHGDILKKLIEETNGKYE
jgi:Sec7-like guanine-nucleotide exchange factor